MAYKHGKKWAVKYREAGQTKTAYFPTQEDADLWQAQRKYDKKYNPRKVAPPTSGDATFSAAIRRYYQDKSKAKEIRQTTKESDLTRLNSVIIPTLGELFTRKMESKDIDKAIEKYRARKVKNVTINRALDIVRAVLRHAGRKDLVIPRLKDDREIVKPPTQAEARKLLTHAPAHVKRAILLGCGTGIRPGRRELFAITWGSVDFDRQEIYVESAKKGGIHQRYVPIAAYLLPKLKEWFEEDGKDEALTIITYKGKQIGTIKTAWKTLLDNAGIKRRMRPYDLRHFFATQTLGSGADVRSVADMMGHRQISTTQEIYQHTLARAKQTAVDMLPDITTEPPKKRRDTN